MKPKSEVMWGLWHPYHGFSTRLYVVKKDAIEYNRDLIENCKVIKVRITEVKPKQRRIK